MTVAAAAFHEPIEGQPVMRHYLVSRFLKAVRIERPRTKMTAPPWCLGSVLSVLAKAPFEPLASCDLKLLTWKVAFLLAISSARRLSELQALSANPPFTIVHGEWASLKTVAAFLPKAASEWHRKQSIELCAFYPSPDESAVQKAICAQLGPLSIHCSGQRT